MVIAMIVATRVDAPLADDVPAHRLEHRMMARADGEQIVDVERVGAHLGRDDVMRFQPSVAGATKEATDLAAVTVAGEAGFAGAVPAGIVVDGVRHRASLCKVCPSLRTIIVTGLDKPFPACHYS